MWMLGEWGVAFIGFEWGIKGRLAGDVGSGSVRISR